jgi:uncharacterized phiE125 gp8 family phage protein
MLTLVVPPTTTPVSVAELKAHLRIDIDAEDALLATYIETATDQAQVQTRRQFLTSTWRYEVSPVGDVVLPWSPFQSIVSVVDGDGASVDYDLDDTGLRAVVTPATSSERLVVTYTVGYGDEPSDVPMAARHAIRILASHYWACREDTGPMPPAVTALLDTVRIRRCE